MKTNLLNIINNKTPIWFMRQAGRYLPEYQKIRKNKKNFIDLCFSPKLACEISLQPIKRFDLDFIILFSDILVIPHILGQKVTFKENIGPLLKPIRKISNLTNVNPSNWINDLSPVFETIDLIKSKSEKKLIGFCGSPFTVLTYMLEGGSSKDHKKTKLNLINNSTQINQIIELLIEISSLYLINQIKAGAEVVKLFDSWAGTLDQYFYEKYVIEPNKKIIKKVKKAYPKVPVIVFPKGSGEKIESFLTKVPCDVISLDKDVSDKVLLLCKKKKIIVQGNLDPIRLLAGGHQLEKKIIEIMKKFNKNDHIFNLSHGIYPETPIRNVEQTIEIVRNYEEFTR